LDDFTIAARDQPAKWPAQGIPLRNNWTITRENSR